MARTKRQHDADLTRCILEEATSFEFFRAVSILERLGPSSAAAVGMLGPVHRESVHFTHDPSFDFAAGDISGIRKRGGAPGDGHAVNPWLIELMSTFLGLSGPTSPMPTHFSEELLELEDVDGEEGRGALRTLYEVLNHRLYALFYRAGRKYRFASEARADETDAFTRRALAFVGVDAQAMPEGGLSAAHLLGLAPLLAIRSRSSRALHVLLEASLPGVPVEIESFVARIVVLEESERNKVGVQNSQLGLNFTIGARVQDRSGRFRTRLGPVTYETLEDLMPNGRHHNRLREVLDQYTRGILEAEVEVVLTEDDTPRFRIGEQRGGTLGASAVLGRMGEGASRVRFTMTADPAGVRPQFIGPVANEPSAEGAPLRVVGARAPSEPSGVG